MQKVIENIKNILVKNLEIPETELNKDQFVIIYDLNSPIAEKLTKAYQSVLPKALSWSFYDLDPQQIIADLNSLAIGTTIILIESSSFRMSNFRWRLELFNRGFKVIEHAHLGTNLPEETENYLDALEDQYDDYQKTANFLQPLLENCQIVTVESQDGSKLVYNGGMEPIKKNIGDFRELRNKGCGFPIGEVFTEPTNLENVNGEVQIYAFANKDHQVIYAEKPFKLFVENGSVSSFSQIEETEVSAHFQEIMDLIKAENPDGKIILREFGLGLNKGLSASKRLKDISAYERVCGMHVSLGMKHDIYRSKVKTKQQRYHIDIFPWIKRITIDQTIVFEDGSYLV